MSDIAIEPNDPLEDAKLVFNRANRNVREFSDGIGHFIRNEAWTTRIDHDPVAGDYVHKLIVSGQPSRHLKVVAREAWGSMRSALDHLNSACMRLAGVEMRKAENRFPFAGSAAEFDAIIGIRSPQVGRPVTDYWKSLGPYPGGDDELHALSTIRNGKEHWKLSAAILEVEGVSIIRKGQPPKIVSAKTGPGAVHEIELFRTADPAADYNLYIILKVSFENITGALGDATSILQRQAVKVGNVIKGTEAVLREHRFI